jgi:hypothetical protein
MLCAMWDTVLTLNTYCAMLINVLGWSFLHYSYFSMRYVRTRRSCTQLCAMLINVLAGLLVVFFALFVLYAP